MITISPYVGVNFRGTEQLQPKKTEINPKKDEATKGMSNTVKAGIGLGALAVAVAAGLAFKGKMKMGKLTINIRIRQEFEKAFGKIDDIDGELAANDVIGMVRYIASKNPKVKQSAIVNLDEKGLDILQEKMNVNISKEIFGKKKALLLQLFDKDSKLLESRPVMADSFDEKLSNMFGDSSVVKLV